MQKLLSIIIFTSAFCNLKCAIDSDESDVESKIKRKKSIELARKKVKNKILQTTHENDGSPNKLNNLKIPKKFVKIIQETTLDIFTFSNDLKKITVNEQNFDLHNDEQFFKAKNLIVDKIKTLEIEMCKKIVETYEKLQQETKSLINEEQRANINALNLWTWINGEASLKIEVQKLVDEENERKKMEEEGIKKPQYFREINVDNKKPQTPTREENQKKETDINLVEKTDKQSTHAPAHPKQNNHIAIIVVIVTLIFGGIWKRESVKVGFYLILNLLKKDKKDEVKEEQFNNEKEQNQESQSTE